MSPFLFTLLSGFSLVGLIVGLAYAIVILCLILWAAYDENHWWIPILTLLAVTVLAWIFFHSWLFAVWTVLLFGAIYLFAKTEGTFWKILGIALAIAICIAGLILTNRFTSIESKPVEVSQPAYVEIVDTTPEPVVNTTAPVVCIEAQIIESQTHGDKVILDLNDGDPFDYGLTIINPDNPTSNQTLVVVTDPMYIFDVVKDEGVMYFTSYRLRGTLDEVLCSAKKLTGNVAPYYIYVGAGDESGTPDGWSVSISGDRVWWSDFAIKQYSEEAITIGVDSLPFQLSTTDKNRDLVSVDVLHGQFWNPTVDGVVVHPQVEKGYTLKAPFGWQGTYWTIADGKPELVQARIIQTSKEVVERDELSLSNVTILYCGATVPTTELKIGEDTLNWVTELEGWTCEVTKE